jgi:hypothetical protein
MNSGTARISPTDAMMRSRDRFTAACVRVKRIGRTAIEASPSMPSTDNLDVRIPAASTDMRSSTSTSRQRREIDATNSDDTEPDATKTQSIPSPSIIARRSSSRPSAGDPSSGKQWNEADAKRIGTKMDVDCSRRSSIRASSSRPTISVRRPTWRLAAGAAMNDRTPQRPTSSRRTARTSIQPIVARVAAWNAHGAITTISSVPSAVAPITARASYRGETRVAP